MTKPDKPRNWKPFPLVAASNFRGATHIDPNPQTSAIKRARLLGLGVGDIRATDKLKGPQ